MMMMCRQNSFVIVSRIADFGDAIESGNAVRKTCIPVVGQNLATRSQAAGKAAYSLEYGFVHVSPMSNDGG